jgi:hypothetical protein
MATVTTKFFVTCCNTRPFRTGIKWVCCMSPTRLQIQRGKVGLAHLTPSLPELLAQFRRRVAVGVKGRWTARGKKTRSSRAPGTRVQAPTCSTACSESLVLGVPAAASAHGMDEGARDDLQETTRRYHEVATIPSVYCT